MNTNTKTAVEKVAVDEKVTEINLVAAPFKAAIEAVINAAPVGNVLAMYDTGADFDAELIASDAADFVLKGLIGSLCYNVIDGRKTTGAKMFNDALDQVDAAAERDAQFRTEKSSDQLQNRIRWAARMDVQQSYRAALEPFVSALYAAVTGERYQRGVSRSDLARPNSPEQGVVAALAARRKAV
jgi:hypothetical protein